MIKFQGYMSSKSNVFLLDASKLALVFSCSDYKKDIIAEYRNIIWFV